MDEFVEGYMKIHTLSNGKRRWSRKASMFEKVSEEDLEKLRMKMDSAMGGGKPNSKDNEANTKDNKDAKTLQRKDSAKPATNDKSKGVKSSEKESEKKSSDKSSEKKSKK